MGRIVTLPAEATGAAPGRGRLAGRRVLVVGAGTRSSPEPDPPIGNGRAISVLAAREGAAVACADRDAEAADATAALVRNEGQKAAVVLADVASPDACAAVVAKSAAALGGLDGLVLNVGIGLGRGMAGTTAAQWDEVFAVNTRAHFLVATAALSVLEPGSAMVFISSAASLRAATGIPAYDASKAALLGICRQAAREGMARGIRANLVVPSLVDTPLGREASRRNPGRTARSLPFGRQATAWEVAYATVWLLSGEASYVNAHPLVLDGGATSFGLSRWIWVRSIQLQPVTRAVQQHGRASPGRLVLAPGRDHKLPSRGLRGYQAVGGQASAHTGRVLHGAGRGPADRGREPRRRRAGHGGHAGPVRVSAETAAVMALDSYPFSGGPAGSVDKVRLQRVVDVMQQFLGFGKTTSARC